MAGTLSLGQWGCQAPQFTFPKHLDSMDRNVVQALYHLYTHQPQLSHWQLHVVPTRTPVVGVHYSSRLPDKVTQAQSTMKYSSPYHYSSRQLAKAPLEHSIPGHYRTRFCSRCPRRATPYTEYPRTPQLVPTLPSTVTLNTGEPWDYPAPTSASAVLPVYLLCREPQYHPSL